MCGLAGIVGEVDLMEQVLLHMSAAQNHRGKETPNSWVSSFIDARVGLMHNRMKTIDMAVAPKQPFEDNDTGLVVMLDGEILIMKTSGASSKIIILLRLVECAR